MKKDKVIALLLLAACSLAHAEVYKWVDASGRTVFSDQPPPAQKPGMKVDKIKVYPGGSSAARAASAPLGAPAAGGVGGSSGNLDADIKNLNERIEKHNQDVKQQNCQTAQANLAALDRAGSKPDARREDMLKRAREEVRIWCSK
ncbi:DUF4124 domain-containing protein [Vogesella urethralis]|uniref:DUF4124 domain-containing protein n=1 Tax=Vogesella urethralis TaxID=2592656 RepID=UPI001184765E|nr:DUF4124 domain-containing protein [Vogesella urethralis]